MPEIVAPTDFFVEIIKPSHYDDDGYVIVSVHEVTVTYVQRGGIGQYQVRGKGIISMKPKRKKKTLSPPPRRESLPSTAWLVRIRFPS